MVGKSEGVSLECRFIDMHYLSIRLYSPSTDNSIAINGAAGKSCFLGEAMPA
jgi:hypothetical protein